jgi:hypothetical protein
MKCASFGPIRWPQAGAIEAGVSLLLVTLGPRGSRFMLRAPGFDGWATASTPPSGPHR